MRLGGVVIFLGGGRVQHQHELAATMVFIRFQPGFRLTQRAGVQLLEALGQFPREQDAPLIPQHGAEVRHGLLDPMGRLVEHQGIRQIAQAFQFPASAGGLGRKKADEQPGRFQPGYRKCGGHRAGAGDGDHRHPSRPRRRHQPRAGIGNAGGTGIRDISHAFSRLQGRHQAAGGGLFVVFVQGRQPRLDAIGGKQAPAVTGVLGGDQVRRAQDIEGMQSQVAQIADRRGNDVKNAGAGGLGDVEHSGGAGKLAAV